MKTIYKIGLLLLCTLKLFAQNEDNFYVVDTITLKNPIVFSIEEYDGLFLTELELLNKKNIKLKSIAKKSDIFLFSFNPYIFFNENQLRQKNIFVNYPNDGNCGFTQSTNKKDGIYYNSFVAKPLKFIVCLVKASHYDKIVSSAHIGKTALHKADKNSYYMILFPFCEEETVQ